VPPFVRERIDPPLSSNPYADHVRHALWLAYRGAQPVGRISAQVDYLYLSRHRNRTGFFGMLEAPDDPSVFRALLGTAETWLRSQGIEYVVGPVSLSLGKESGILMADFEGSPTARKDHAPGYHADRLAEQGYSKEKDLLAFSLLCREFRTTRAMASITRRKPENVRVRPLDKPRLDRDLVLLREIFDDAWSGHWGFVPPTSVDFKELGQLLRLLADPAFVQIAEIDGYPAAMLVMLPNLHETAHDLHGRRLSLDRLKQLWRLKMAPPTSGRIALMGVRRAYQRRRLGAAAVFLMMEALRQVLARRGIEHIDMAPVLEDNWNMRSILDSTGASLSRRYRIYGKGID